MSNKTKRSIDNWRAWVAGRLLTEYPTARMKCVIGIGRIEALWIHIDRWDANKTFTNSVSLSLNELNGHQDSKTCWVMVREKVDNAVRELDALVLTEELPE